VVHQPTTTLAPTQRSAVTNGSRILAGVNGRSAAARRFRDVVVSLEAELGGELSESERLQVRNAATLQLHSEELAARLIRGEAVDPEEITRAANGATRALAGLRKRRAAKPAAGGGVRDYLASKAAAA